MLISITEATREELPEIRELALKTWPVTFGKILSSEQIAYMLEWMYSIPSLEQQHASGHHFLVAKEGNHYLGYAAYEAPEGLQIVRLHKIYLLPSAQGRGVGKQLLHDVIDRTRRLGISRICLNVNRYNKAIHFYEKAGFIITGEEDNEIGNGFFMNDFVMELVV